MTKRNTIRIEAGPSAPIVTVEREVHLRPVPGSTEQGWVIYTWSDKKLIRETLAPTRDASLQALREDVMAAAELVLDALDS